LKEKQHTHYNNKKNRLTSDVFIILMMLAMLLIMKNFIDNSKSKWCNNLYSPLK